MLGPELVGQLAKILARRRDPRGWMPSFEGFAHDEFRRCDGYLTHVVQRSEAATAATARAARARIEVQDAEHVATAHEGDPPRATELREATSIVFDYAADLGDSSDAMYAIALACQCDFDAGGAELKKGTPLSILPKTEGKQAQLPRGQFLFVGGDTAYHVADEVTVQNRVVEPFRWATEDLDKDGARATTGMPPRLYGIPGNHDWYDNLSGFREVFQRRPHAPRRRPQTAPHCGSSLQRPVPDEQELADFVPVQRASYVAIKLPHEWQLWGLDIDSGLDPRQRAYFDSLMPNGAPPKRLILCTPSPPVAMRAEIAPKKHREALKNLGLPEAYRRVEELASGACRLDLSGDIHHYARFQKDDRYAVVVSGLGGAFHHPSFTHLGTRQAAEIFPAENDSLSEVGERLLNFKSLLVGSWIRAFPILFALLLGGASRAGGAFTFLFRPFLSGGGDGSRDAWARAGVEVLVIVSVLLAIALAVVWFERIYGVQLADPARRRGFFDGWTDGRLRGAFDPYRSYWLPTGMLGVAAFVPFMFRYVGHDELNVSGYDVGGIILVVVLLTLTTGMAVIVGAKHHRSGRTAFGVLGFVHGLAQLVSALLCFHLATSSIPTGATLASFEGQWLLSPVLAVLTVFAASRALVCARDAFAKRSARQVAVFAVVPWLVGFGGLLWAAGPSAVHLESSAPMLLVRDLLGCAFAMFAGTNLLTWYFAIAALMNGHNNEVGGAARVTKFRQFIRFRIDSHGLTGYVVAVEGEAKTRPLQRDDLTFKLIDVFRVVPPRLDA